MRGRVEISDERGVRLRHLQEVVGRAEARSFDGAGNVEHGKAFRHDHGMEVDVSTAKALLDVDDIGGLIEEIFASLERASMMVVVPQDEGFLTADDASVLEFSGDAVSGIPRAEHDKGLAWGLNR